MQNRKNSNSRLMALLSQYAQISGTHEKVAEDTTKTVAQKNKLKKAAETVFANLSDSSIVTFWQFATQVTETGQSQRLKDEIFERLYAFTKKLISQVAPESLKEDEFLIGSPPLEGHVIGHSHRIEGRFYAKYNHALRYFNSHISDMDDASFKKYLSNQISQEALAKVEAQVSLKDLREPIVNLIIFLDAQAITDIDTAIQVVKKAQSKDIYEEYAEVIENLSRKVPCKLS